MKRGRAQTGQISRRSKRPIDKKLMNVNLGPITNAQVNTPLIDGANFPGTITGIRWNINYVRTVFNANTIAGYVWAIVIVPAGTAISNLTVGNGSSMYDPEQNVLAFGTGNSYSNAFTSNCQKSFEGSTKSMRKLKNGDKLVFVALGTATEACYLYGTIQWFYKT